MAAEGSFKGSSYMAAKSQTLHDYSELPVSLACLKSFICGLKLPAILTLETAKANDTLSKYIFF